MKFIVCIKQVPEVSELKFDNAKRTLIRDGVRNEINPFDRRALTFASEARTKYGGEVVVITMGPPQAKEALIEALAMGADRAVHLLDRSFAGSDTLATARALALSIQKERPFDMVLCGKHSVDAETGHIGPEVAQLLGIAHVTSVTNVEFTQSSNQILLRSETDYGFQTIRSTLPVLITAAERLIKPGRSTTQTIEAAKQKPYKIVRASDLAPDTSIFGFAGSPTSVKEIYSVEAKRKRVIIDEKSMREKTRVLIQSLVQHGLFTGWREIKRAKIKPPDQRKASNKAFWVLAESAKGRIREVTYELLGSGLQLSDQIGSELCAVLIGDAPDEFARDLIKHGADRVYLIKHEHLSKYSSDAYASALADAIQTYHPYAVVAAATSFGRDFVPRVAAQLGLGMTSDCIGLEINDQLKLVQLKPAFGGNIVAPIVSSTHPQIATIRPGMLTEAESNPSHRGTVVQLHPKIDSEPLSKLVEEQVEENSDNLQLDNADVVVCVGFGVGGPENINKIKDFAELMNAPLAATRKVVDLKWMPRQLQIGLTGRSISPRLYFGIGVSGAFNHMVGLGRANLVVAINNDPNALIFKNCDYGIVGDYAEVLPLLSEEIRTTKLGTA
jgi:electron transfer flavoprotein alpha subunit